MSVSLTPARLLAPWRRRLAAWLKARTHENCVLRVDADERVRTALNTQLKDLYDHIHDRDLHIRLLQGQVRELGGAPRELQVIRRPLPTFIPGPGVSVSR